MANNAINKNKKISGLPRRTAIIIIIIIMAVLLFVSFRVLISDVNDLILSYNISTMKELSLHDEKSIENSVELRFEQLETMAAELEKQTFSSEDEFLSALKRVADYVSYANYVSLVNSETGVEYQSSGIVYQSSSSSSLLSGKTEKFITRQNINWYFKENSKEVLIEAIPISITYDNVDFDWLLCEFPVDTLESELKITSYDGQGYSSVVDGEGNYIINISKTHNFMTYDNFYEDMADITLEGYSGVDELLTTTTTTGATSVIYTKDGVENIMVITAIDFADWYFITTVPASVFNTQTNAIVRLFMILLAAIVMVGIAAAILLLYQRRQREVLQHAEIANKAKTDFLFNMSHDIRTPMNAILGYTDIGLRHADDTEQAQASFKKIKMAGNHLLNLINDILEMSRIESGKVELTETPLDMRRSIAGIVQMNQSLATAKSIDFEVDVDGIKNPYVYADELHINEVIINLISNAIKYTPEGGKVWYTAHQLGDVRDGVVNYRFEISDTGIGISEEFQKHLFEAFSREESSGVSKIEGAGLGLSIVKRIVDLAGGTISVKSKLGEGSTFTVEFAFRVMTDEEIATFVAEADASVEIPSEDKFAGKRILLVEDNEMNREIATEILTEAGFNVESAEDGELAVEAVAENGIEYFDFILMDIQMPVMNGYEATQAIRSLQDGDKVPIIALSANAFAEDKEASLAAGMNDHVAKPIDVKSLFATLAKFL